MEIFLPVVIKSEANLREHWTAVAARKKKQKTWVLLALKACAPDGALLLPCRVTFTRIGVRLLDSDNLSGGFKAVRDAVASWLGVDDGPSAPVTWEYAQIKGKPPGFTLRIDSLI